MKDQNVDEVDVDEDHDEVNLVDLANEVTSLSEMLDMLNVLIAMASGDEKSAHASIMTRTEFIDKMKGRFKRIFDATDTDSNSFVDEVEFLAAMASICMRRTWRSLLVTMYDTNMVTACGSDNGSKCQHPLPPGQCSVISD